MYSKLFLVKRMSKIIEDEHSCGGGGGDASVVTWYCDGGVIIRTVLCGSGVISVVLC